MSGDWVQLLPGTTHADRKTDACLFIVGQEEQGVLPVGALEPRSIDAGQVLLVVVRGLVGLAQRLMQRATCAAQCLQSI